MRPPKGLMTAAALLLLGAAPAVAQDAGGIRLRGPASVLDRVEQVGSSGCRLSQTSVTVGVNRATGNDSTARQALATDASGSCRPLVTTQVTAGINLGLGARSTAEQSIEARGSRGTLATTAVNRGVNLSVGHGSTTAQQILAQVGR